MPCTNVFVVLTLASTCLAGQAMEVGHPGRGGTAADSERGVPVTPRVRGLVGVQPEPHDRHDTHIEDPLPHLPEGGRGPWKEERRQQQAQPSTDAAVRGVEVPSRLRRSPSSSPHAGVRAGHAALQEHWGEARTEPPNNQRKPQHQDRKPASGAAAEPAPVGAAGEGEGEREGDKIVAATSLVYNIIDTIRKESKEELERENQEAEAAAKKEAEKVARLEATVSEMKGRLDEASRKAEAADEKIRVLEHVHERIIHRAKAADKASNDMKRELEKEHERVIAEHQRISKQEKQDLEAAHQRAIEEHRQQKDAVTQQLHNKNHEIARVLEDHKTQAQENEMLHKKLFVTLEQKERGEEKSKEEEQMFKREEKMFKRKIGQLQELLANQEKMVQEITSDVQGTLEAEKLQHEEQKRARDEAIDRLSAEIDHIRRHAQEVQSNASRSPPSAGAEVVKLKEDLKNDLSCPISGSIFQDPVIAADGHTYERESIEQWFAHQNRRRLPTTSPITREDLPNRVLIPNRVVMKVIDSIKDSGSAGASHSGQR